MKYHFFTAALLGLIISTPSHAQAVKIQISKSTDQLIPLAISPFQGSAAEDITTIVYNDLKRSGRFKLIAPQSVPQTVSAISQITPALWQNTGVTYASVGRVDHNQISMELGNVLIPQTVFNTTLTHNNTTQMRHNAHRIADLIFQKITGIPGSFNSRIAYVAKEGRNYRLVVADADGANPKTILSVNEPIFSPTWSPDGKKLAYSTLEGKRSRLVIQDIVSGKRQIISEVPGINSAPSWSPDGNYLAFTMSKEGNPDIYTIAINGAQLKRITDHPGIDTEPFWARDGNLYFTSDRGGKPQIYRVSAAGGTPARVTYQGQYNAKANVSPDNQYLLSMQNNGSGFGIALTNLTTNTTTRLSNGRKDESPSFSSNGQMIIYSTGADLSVISLDGRTTEKLPNTKNARDPSWSPTLP